MQYEHSNSEFFLLTINWDFLPKDCGEPCYSHQTLAETKKEREDRGHPVGHDTMYQAMGGLTGFRWLLKLKYLNCSKIFHLI